MVARLAVTGLSDILKTALDGQTSLRNAGGDQLYFQEVGGASSMGTRISWLERLLTRLSRGQVPVDGHYCPDPEQHNPRPAGEPPAVEWSPAFLRLSRSVRDAAQRDLHSGGAGTGHQPLQL
jgi:hypothetical protein